MICVFYVAVHGFARTLSYTGKGPFLSTALFARTSKTLSSHCHGNLTRYPRKQSDSVNWWTIAVLSINTGSGAVGDPPQLAAQISATSRSALGVITVSAPRRTALTGAMLACMARQLHELQLQQELALQEQHRLHQLQQHLMDETRILTMKPQSILGVGSSPTLPL